VLGAAGTRGKKPFCKAVDGRNETISRVSSKKNLAIGLRRIMAL